jgi:anti-sigma28 factor (negative regulator of flagellin synthesis)
VSPIRPVRPDLPLNRPGEGVQRAADRPSGPANDALKITAFAEALQAIESGSTGDAMVDSSRVVDVRQALVGGTYVVDSAQLARNLVSFETQVYGGQG